MPSARLGPETTQPQSTSEAPKIFKSEYRHNLIDTSVTPLQTVITQIGGYPIFIDYYSANIGRDQDVDGYNPDQNSPLQQYTRIKNVKFKLSSAMNYSMTSGNSVDVYTGDGKLAIPGITPKEGDVFVADIGQGRLGIFTVTNPLGLSQYDNRAHQLDFKLTMMGTIDEMNSLDARVTRKLNYVEDFIVSGQNPLLTDESLNDLNDAQKLISTLTKQYMADAFSQENSTLSMPGQYTACYDPYLADFVMELIGVDDHPAIRLVKRPNVDDFKTTSYIDILSVLLDRDASMLSMCFHEASLRPCSDYSRNKQVGSIAYSGFENVVYPVQILNGPDSAAADYESDTGYLGETIRNTAPHLDLPDETRLFDTIGGIDGSSKSYIFNPSFYDGTNDDESLLTQVVRQYLEGTPVDRALLLTITRTRMTWSPIDRFYYTPILIMLLRASLLEI